ncbi:hypothetical protein FGB62_1g262 [Gracilaria domingensis]|nr:hypothetical protein FGB62_1g262 [Gracilaria domingensis]
MRLAAVLGLPSSDHASGAQRRCTGEGEDVAVAVASGGHEDTAVASGLGGGDCPSRLGEVEHERGGSLTRGGRARGGGALKRGGGEGMGASDVEASEFAVGGQVEDGMDSGRDQTSFQASLVHDRDKAAMGRW